MTAKGVFWAFCCATMGAIGSLVLFQAALTPIASPSSGMSIVDTPTGLFGSILFLPIGAMLGVVLYFFISSRREK